MEKRRTFLRNSSIVLGELVAESLGFGPVSLIKNHISPDNKYRADMANYRPMSWGSGEISSEEMAGASSKWMKEKIDNPSKALSWVGYVKKYSESVSNFSGNSAKGSRSFFGKYAGVLRDISGMRKGFNGWNSRLSFNQSFKNSLEFWDLSSKTSLQIREMLGGGRPMSFEKQIELDNYLTKQEDLDFRVYANIVMGSDHNNVEKKRLLKLSEEDRRLFPYASRINSDFIDKSGLSSEEVSDLAEDYNRGRPSESDYAPVCEDVVVSLMQALKGNGYPALGLVVSKDFETGPANHIVYLVKGKEGYGYIGWNPDVQVSYPSERSRTVKDLVRNSAHFGDSDRCLVVDFERQGLLDQIEKNYGNFDSFSVLARNAIPVDKYPD